MVTAQATVPRKWAQQGAGQVPEEAPVEARGGRPERSADAGRSRRSPGARPVKLPGDIRRRNRESRPTGLTFRTEKTPALPGGGVALGERAAVPGQVHAHVTGRCRVGATVTLSQDVAYCASARRRLSADLPPHGPRPRPRLGLMAGIVEEWPPPFFVLTFYFTTVLVSQENQEDSTGVLGDPTTEPPSIFTHQ